MSRWMRSAPSCLRAEVPPRTAPVVPLSCCARQRVTSGRDGLSSEPDEKFLTVRYERISTTLLLF
jgi:hypothetical protein